MAEISNPKSFTHLFAISSVDGRFRGNVQQISNFFSEFAIMKQRILIETEWLLQLSHEGIIRKFTSQEQKLLQNLYKNFLETDAQRIWDIDLKINHDVKSHEIFIAEKLKNTSLEDIINYIHFGLTSTDVDNLAFALSLKEYLKTLFYPAIYSLLKEISDMARLHKLTVMLGRTHGVPALPTTAGKEMINFAVDLKNQLIILRETEITAKISGAVGNRNELNIAFPKKDWKNITETFIKRLNLAPQTHTTQIESHSNKILIFNLLSQIARIGAKLAQDLWIYNSLGYLSWKDNAGHVGSSVMPHKINPIGAELAQTYFVTGSETLHVIANIIMENRMQRDLRDKYALRKTGEALAELLLAIEGITGSLRQIGFNEKKLADELNNHWEVLSASIQTILRIENVENPYDLLKKLSRGNTWTQEKFRNIIFQLPIEKSVKEKLQSLSPLTSTGEAVALVEDGIAQVNSFLKQS